MRAFELMIDDLLNPCESRVNPCLKRVYQRSSAFICGFSCSVFSVSSVAEQRDKRQATSDKQDRASGARTTPGSCNPLLHKVLR